MRIFLGGHLTFYHPQKEKWLEIVIQAPTALSEILEEAGIPLGEVHLVVLNDEHIELEKAVVSDQDEVQIYSPVGGG
jgi:sulfur carrier protein ThiS